MISTNIEYYKSAFLKFDVIIKHKKKFFWKKKQKTKTSNLIIMIY